MAKTCCSYNVKNIFISGLVYNERVKFKTLEKIHDKIVIVFSKLSLQYIEIRNINTNFLFKDRFHLVESGKTILENNFISNLNNFWSCTSQLNVLI